MNDWAEFSALQSSLHQSWAFWACGKLGSSTLSYSTSAALETWPMPLFPSEALRSSVAEAGEIFHAKRDEILRSRSIGLTEFYNSFHEQTCRQEEFLVARQLLVSMDEAVCLAYGWKDVDLGHDFHEVPYLPENDRVRFTISEGARLKLLQRLAELNLQRYQQEVNEGLHGATSAPSKGRARRSRAVSASEPALDLDEIPSTLIDGGD